MNVRLTRAATIMLVLASVGLAAAQTPAPVAATAPQVSVTPVAAPAATPVPPSRATRAVAPAATPTPTLRVIPMVAAPVAAGRQTPPPSAPARITTAPQSGGRGARAPEATTTPQVPTPAMVRRTFRGQLVNLRLEFTITDQIGSAAPVHKTVTMNVADGESGRIRTNADVYRKNSPATTVPLSIDASPEVEGTRIRLRASLEYQLLNEAMAADLPGGKTSITQSVTSILNDGVQVVLCQSADPLTDRKVTLEVKATILK